MTAQPTRLLAPLWQHGVTTASELAVTAADPFAGSLLPVREDLAELLPRRGLARGGTVAIEGSVALLLVLLSQASAAGSWIAVVGMPELGLLAADERGIALERVALVPTPGAQIANVVGALLDGVDVVVVASKCLAASSCRPPVLARRLSSRARHRGAVLMSFGPWAAADLELGAEDVRWTGIGAGRGSLIGQTGRVSVHGRAGAARRVERRVSLSGTRLDEIEESMWSPSRASRVQ